jgi:hypothetical protein
LEAGCEVLGVEGYRPAVENSRVPGRVVLHDYSTGPFVPDRGFDMAWSSEFVEHIEEQHIPNFFATFACAGYIFMTFAKPGQGGSKNRNIGLRSSDNAGSISTRSSRRAGASSPWRTGTRVTRLSVTLHRKRPGFSKTPRLRHRTSHGVLRQLKRPAAPKCASRTRCSSAPSAPRQLFGL